MAFRERSAWVSLVATLGVYGVYFFQFGQALIAGRSSFQGAMFIEAVVALLVIQVGLHIILAIAAGREAGAPQDERERLIQQRAGATAFYVLQAAAACAAASVYLFDRGAVANFVLAAMALAQVAQYGAVIIGYRTAL